jgi:hypothetical protein
MYVYVYIIWRVVNFQGGIICIYIYIYIYVYIYAHVYGTCILYKASQLQSMMCTYTCTCIHTYEHARIYRFLLIHNAYCLCKVRHMKIIMRICIWICVRICIWMCVWTDMCTVDALCRDYLKKHDEFVRVNVYGYVVCTVCAWWKIDTPCEEW